MIDPLSILNLTADRESPYLLTEAGALTRGVLFDRGAVLARVIQDAGVTVNDGVIVSLDSGPSFVEALVGAWLAGATPILLDPLVRSELHRAVGLTNAKAVLRTGDTDPSSDIPVITPLVATAAQSVDVPPYKRSDTDPILYLFTSGSTGEPTLVPKTYEQLDVEVRFIQELFSSPTRVATMAPWCHIFGLLFSCLLPARTRGVVHLEAGISPKTMLNLAATHETDLVVVVPAVLQVMTKYLEAGEDMSLPRRCQFACSGAPLSADLRAKFEALTGCVITDLYGSTEAGGVAYRRDDGPWRVEPHVAIRTTHEGFLEVASPSVSFPGEGGYYRIGDMVRRADGGFFLENRSDDVVKIGGRRTSLKEVTETLEACPGVRAAACIATKIRGATRLAAFVESEDENLRPTAIRTFVRGQLADHKVPRVIRLVDALPRTPAKKIDKRALKRLEGGK